MSKKRSGQIDPVWMNGGLKNRSGIVNYFVDMA